MIKVALEAELKLVMMEVDKEMNSEAVEAVILKLMQHRNFSKKILAVGSIGSKCKNATQKLFQKNSRCWLNWLKMLASRHFGKFAHLPDDSRAKDNNEKSIPWNISQPKKSWKCGL